MENTRPKMSFSPRLFTPFFSRALCSLLTLSSSDSMVDSSCSSFSAVAMVVCARARGWVRWAGCAVVTVHGRVDSRVDGTCAELCVGGFERWLCGSNLRCPEQRDPV